jgi:hypothetical protein
MSVTETLTTGWMIPSKFIYYLWPHKKYLLPFVYLILKKKLYETIDLELNNSYCASRKIVK